MSDAGSQADQADLSKLKVADLKKMLKTRGLSVLGNKQELIDRLQSSEAAAEALLEGSDVGDIDEELDREIDEAALDDESSKAEQEIEEPLKVEVKPAEPAKPLEPPKPAETSTPNDKPAEGEKKEANGNLNGTWQSATQEKPKHKRITITDVTTSDANARKKARLERFNQTPAAAAPAKTETTESKRARFASTTPSKTEVTTTIVTDPIKKAEEPKSDAVGGTDKLKKRAERFGILSPAELKKQQLEKLQARKARFAAGATPPTVTTAAEKTSVAPIPEIKKASSLDEKKRLRAERFKVST